MLKNNKVVKGRWYVPTSCISQFKSASKTLILYEYVSHGFELILKYSQVVLSGRADIFPSSFGIKGIFLVGIISVKR